jgi:predicted DNA-binding transcriptional regulator YafY
MRNVRAAPMTHSARVVVQAPAAVITERVPRGIVVEPIDENTCAVHASANSIEMLALYLGMLDAEFTVTEPPELLARLSKMAERFSTAVSR